MAEPRRDSGVEYDSVGEDYFEQRKLQSGSVGWVLLAGLGVQRSTPATGGGGGGSEGKGGAETAPLLLAAVAHAQMDREHEGLADAADALRQQRSLASLRRLRRGGDAAEMRRDAGRCGSLASSRCS